MFGINGGELLLLLLVVALVIGPERLPAFAEQLGRWARSLRGFVSSARSRVEDELGDTPVDWEALDPRRYDPRRIVREALLEDPKPARAKNVPRRAPAPAPRPAAAASSGPAPYDDEAT